MFEEKTKEIIRPAKNKNALSGMRTDRYSAATKCHNR